jgi:hypothetical protein
MTLWLSVIYLLSILFSILLSPFSTAEDPLIFLHRYSILLGVFQGLLNGVMGAFFTQKEQTAA